MSLGDANKTEIKELWNSKKMQNFRKLHLENKKEI